MNNSCFIEYSNGNSKLARETQTIALFELQPKNENIKSYSVLSFPSTSFFIFLSPIPNSVSSYLGYMTFCVCMPSTLCLQVLLACKLVRIIIMPFLQAMVATVERHSRPLGLLILNDQNHVSRRPGTKSTSLLADKNYLHICRPPRPARRKNVQKYRES